MVATTISFSNVQALVERSLHVLETSGKPQVFIGIGGGPGSGKSTLAQTVSDAINSGDDISIVLPMDGYHFSKAELRQLASLGNVIGDPDDTPGESTTYQDLMRRRGAPWTFDSKSLIRDLTDAKQKGEGSFSTYSRDISDPVPNGAVVSHEHKIVLCEGNYLLALNDPDWKPLESIWDDKWYIAVEQDVVVERLVNRHLERWNDEKRKLWGDGRGGALRKAEASDLKNYQWIQANSPSHANVIIENN